VNLIGDHTDYQDGWCLPAAIDRHVDVAFAARPDGRVVASSSDVDGTVELDGELRSGPAWGRIVAAVIEVLGERGRPPVGFDAEVSSTVPLGAGLSSSAALEVALALAAAHAADFALSRRDLALVAQTAEHRATRVPCGVMDQIASVFGVAGHALLLDCRSLEVEPVALPESVDILVVHSGVTRTLETSAYAARREACARAADRLGVPTLRDAALADVRDDPIARHVVSENARVLDFVAALRAGDRHAAGKLMLASHASLRDDFQVSIPELDELVELLVRRGAFGARLTGAGFGGCVVALMPRGTAAPLAAELRAQYRAFAVQASAGAAVDE
jgi:galactokinase